MSDLPSERDLLLRARKGDEGAARSLWERLAPRMIGYAGLIAGAAEAEDIAQVVFLRALRARRREIARIDDLAAWLLRATRNEALNTRRSDQRRQTRERSTAGAAGAPALYAVQGAAGPSAEADRSLHAALSALPQELHEAVWLRHIAGLTFDQLAAALDLPRSTAASRYRAGMCRLREALASAEKEPSHA